MLRILQPNVRQIADSNINYQFYYQTMAITLIITLLSLSNADKLSATYYIVTDKSCLCSISTRPKTERISTSHLLYHYE